jgi:hypothetical protein
MITKVKKMFLTMAQGGNMVKCTQIMILSSIECIWEHKNNIKMGG